MSKNLEIIIENIIDYPLSIFKNSTEFISKFSKFYGRILFLLGLIPILGLIIFIISLSIPGLILYCVIYREETIDKIFEINVVEEINSII